MGTCMGLLSIFGLLQHLVAYPADAPCVELQSYSGEYLLRLV